MENLDVIIRGGESSFVEFKEERVHPDSLAKEMAAFANTAGGAIFIWRIYAILTALVAAFP